MQETDDRAFERMKAALSPLPLQPPPPALHGSPSCGTVERVPRYRVRHDVPPIYDAYLKLLHPIWENLDIPDFEETWDMWDKAQPKPEGLHPMVEIFGRATLQRSSPGQPFRRRRISWRSLGRLYGVEMRPTISVDAFTQMFPDGSWPRRLVGPSEGRMAPEAADALAGHLARHTPNGRCRLYFWLLTACDMVDHHFLADLAELPSAWIEDDNLHASPTYWFAEDLSWTVYTDWDSSETLIGGSRALADDLLRDPTIECIEVTADTPLGRYAERDPRPDENVVIVEDGPYD